MLAVLAVAPVALHGDDGLCDFHGVTVRAETHDIGSARIGVLLTVSHAHSAADSNVPANDIAACIDNRDVAEIMCEHIDVVRWRHCHNNFEFPRQVGFAVDRFNDFLLPARDTLAVKPNLTIRRCAR